MTRQSVLETKPPDDLRLISLVSPTGARSRLQTHRGLEYSLGFQKYFRFLEITSRILEIKSRVLDISLMVQEISLMILEIRSRVFRKLFYVSMILGVNARLSRSYWPQCSLCKSLSHFHPRLANIAAQQSHSRLQIHRLQCGQHEVQYGQARNNIGATIPAGTSRWKR